MASEHTRRPKVGLLGSDAAVCPDFDVDGRAHLGYPVYFARILGIWEVLTGIAFLAPRFPRLKEWAYAGILFNMTGAAASRAVRGDDVSHIVAPLVFAGLAVASWALRPESRSLGVLSPAEKRA